MFFRTLWAFFTFISMFVTGIIFIMMNTYSNFSQVICEYCVVYTCTASTVHELQWVQCGTSLHCENIMYNVELQQVHCLYRVHCTDYNS